MISTFSVAQAHGNDGSIVGGEQENEIIIIIKETYSVRVLDV